MAVTAMGTTRAGNRDGVCILRGDGLQVRPRVQSTHRDATMFATLLKKMHVLLRRNTLPRQQPPLHTRAVPNQDLWQQAA